MVQHVSTYACELINDVHPKIDLLRQIVRSRWLGSEVMSLSPRYLTAYATNLLNTGTELIDIQSLLGHSTFNTT